jgi:hypothetical protein
MSLVQHFVFLSSPYVPTSFSCQSTGDPWSARGAIWRAEGVVGGGLLWAGYVGVVMVGSKDVDV